MNVTLNIYDEWNYTLRLLHDNHMHVLFIILLTFSIIVRPMIKRRAMNEVQHRSLTRISWLMEKNFNVKLANLTSADAAL